MVLRFYVQATNLCVQGIDLEWAQAFQKEIIYLLDLTKEGCVVKVMTARHMEAGHISTYPSYCVLCFSLLPKQN